MDELLKGLRGLTYQDWIKLRIAIDRYFDRKKKELEGRIQLEDIKEIQELIRSQFGQILG